MIRDQGQLDIFPASVIPKSIRHVMKRIWAEKDGRVAWFPHSKIVAADDSNMGLRMIIEPATLSSVLKYVADSELLGYNSYAEFATSPTMSETPEAVVSFLEDLSIRIRGKEDKVKFNTCAPNILP